MKSNKTKIGVHYSDIQTESSSEDESEERSNILRKKVDEIKTESDSDEDSPPISRPKKNNKNREMSNKQRQNIQVPKIEENKNHQKTTIPAMKLSTEKSNQIATNKVPKEDKKQNDTNNSFYHSSISNLINNHAQESIRQSRLFESLKNYCRHIHDEEKWQKSLEMKAKWSLEQKTINFICCVCYEQYKKSDKYIQCSDVYDVPRDPNKEKHDMCRNCLKDFVDPENVSLDPHGRDIKCPIPECDSIILVSKIQKFIDENSKNQLIDLIGNISISQIPNVFRCHHCNYRLIVENEKPSYECPDCKRKNCKLCEREYIDDHVGRTCQELQEYEESLKKQNKKNAEMNEVIVHQCHKCGMQFVKDDGCNKMTCRCGATQCYLCRAKDITYDHFGGKCQLFADPKNIENQRLNQINQQN